MALPVLLYPGGAVFAFLSSHLRYQTLHHLGIHVVFRHDLGPLANQGVQTQQRTGVKHQGAGAQLDFVRHFGSQTVDLLYLCFVFNFNLRMHHNNLPKNCRLVLLNRLPCVFPHVVSLLRLLTF